MCLPAQEMGGNNDYVYGRVMGLFHANIVYGGSGSLDYRKRRFDFLWIRWFTEISSGGEIWSSKQMQRVKLAPLTDPSSWGFVDPSCLVRCAHIIPRFSLGLRYGENVAKRIFSKAAQDEHDWNEYYVNP